MKIIDSAKFLKKSIIYSLSSVLIFSGASKAADPSKSYVTFHTSKNYLTHINRGYIAMDMMDYSLALKEFLTARYLDSDIFAAHEGLGRIYELTKNYKEALQSYQTALDLISPKYAGDLISKIQYYKANKELKNTLGLYKIVLSIRPEAGLQVLYGDQYKKQGSWQKALVSYKRAYTLQENPNEYLKYIQIKYPNKEYERYVVSKYIQNSLSYPEAHFKAGLIDLEKGYYYPAIDEFNNAVNKITVPAYENKYIYYLALAYYKLGIMDTNYPSEKNLDKAISFFNKYIKSDPNNTDVLFSLADAYFYSDIAKSSEFNKDLEVAEKEFEKVQSLPVQDPEYLDKKKELMDVLNEKYNPQFYEKTIDTLLTIKNINSREPGVYYSLGNIYFKKGNMYHRGFYDHFKNMNAEKSSVRDKAYSYYKKSLDEYKTYINKNPRNNGLVYYDIGVVYYQSSKLEPNRYNLPINADNKKEYERYGPKFYRRDMLTHAIANFNKYLNYYPNAKNSAEVRNLIREMQLAMMALW